MREFIFTYQVPQADVMGITPTEIECECRGFVHFESKEIYVLIDSKKFTNCCFSDLWNANATYVKLLEAAKQHYINHYSNAKPSLMSEQEVNDIVNYNKQN
jgi:hypothetical protein